MCVKFLGLGVDMFGYYDWAFVYSFWIRVGFGLFSMPPKPLFPVLYSFRCFTKSCFVPVSFYADFGMD